MKNIAISTTIGELLNGYNKNQFTKECHDFVEYGCELPVGDANDRSWDDCYEFLKENLPNEEKYKDFSILFEYIMPESIRRADVIILTKTKVIIFEFKNKNKILVNDIAQAGGYRKSIEHYHFITQENELEVISYLVYTHQMPSGRSDLIDVLYPGNFKETIKYLLLDNEPMTNSECQEWLDSPFHPLKNIAEATLQLFRDGDLPNIKTIREGHIKDTLNSINYVIDDLSITKSIIFLAGVPGAGKTLVGLKTVYDHASTDKQVNPIYLSGNDPLVNILQNTLSKNKYEKEGESYIWSIKNYKYHYAYGDEVPNNNIIIFDEAQRAWDTDRKKVGENEATILLSIGDKIANKIGKITIICLIGQGQSIHKGEEKGMPLWANALRDRNDWDVYIPDVFIKEFEQINNYNVDSNMFLDVSIRNDFIDISPWVEAILNADLEKAQELYRDMLKNGFKLWIFRNLDNIKKIVKFIDNEYPGSHTGIITSSHMRDNRNYTIGKKLFGTQYRGSYIKADEAYNWYMEESHSLTRAASEFLIQGIELEWPIVSFTGDYYLQNGKWIVSSNATDPGVDDLPTIMKNIYRVLLTRSRKGMFVYIPPLKKLTETYNWFAEMRNINNK